MSMIVVIIQKTFQETFVFEDYFRGLEVKKIPLN